ncbi:MAG: hypothetical protein JW925_10770 [Syntrophaceae bacterium]|nr:hypothetical protein [Syntrophaceae bacterium]
MTFLDFMEKKPKEGKLIILRHDVDRSPGRAMQLAELENQAGVRGTYYFRIKEAMFPEDEIKKTAAMGHEIGYHYEDLDVARGDVEKALASFKRNLESLRKIVPVRTICMHGSPMSRFDNRKLWRDHDYRSYGIIGEPYFDIDYNEVMYLTDTGRRWDGDRVSIRDKVRGERLEVRGQKTEVRSQESESGKKFSDEKNNEIIKRPKLHSTQDIINALRNGELPDQIMLTIHPQRWTDDWGPWVWELMSQKVKNVVKYLIVKSRQ